VDQLKALIDNWILIAQGLLASVGVLALQWGVFRCTASRPRYAELRRRGNQIDEFVSGRARGDGGPESAQKGLASALLDGGQNRGTNDHPPIRADD
jgi:hypothetical protein